MKAEEQTRKSRFRLLPPDSEVGWTPFAWLIYLAIFIAYLPAVATTPADWAISITAIVLFLVLYFTGYWLRDRRTLWVIAGITSIGVALAPGNPMACIFFIYAGAFAGMIGPPRTSALLIGAIVAALAVETWIFDLSPTFWIPGLVFTVIIGGVNSHFSEAARVRAKLQRAEEEIEHLARLAERERIARDLHDLLGHTLSLITLKSELAGKLVALDPDKATAEILDIERISRSALAEVRQTVAGYRSTGLEAELAHSKAALSAAAIIMRSDTADAEVRPAEGRLLAQVLREATTNIIRHSGANECSISLERSVAGLRLTIKDNGRGPGDAEEGHGIQGMRRRLEAVGGRLRVENDNGTCLVAELDEQDTPPSAALAFDAFAAKAES